MPPPARRRRSRCNRSGRRTTSSPPLRPGPRPPAAPRAAARPAATPRLTPTPAVSRNRPPAAQASPTPRALAGGPTSAARTITATKAVGRSRGTWWRCRRRARRRSITSGAMRRMRGAAAAGHRPRVPVPVRAAARPAAARCPAATTRTWAIPASARPTAVLPACRRPAPTPAGPGAWAGMVRVRMARSARRHTPAWATSSRPATRCRSPRSTTSPTRKARRSPCKCRRATPAPASAMAAAAAAARATARRGCPSA